MLELYPAETKKRFTQMFIREVLLNTSSANFYFLEELISRKEMEAKEKRSENYSEERLENEKLDKRGVKEIVKEYYDKTPRERVREYFRETGDKINFDVDLSKYDSAGKAIQEDPSPKVKNISIPISNVPRRTSSKQVLRVPEGSVLPNRFRSLQPVRENQPINLGKLNLLLNDNNVKSIECPGAGSAVLVNGSMGRKPTNILLSNQEINETIQTFSRNAKIPVEEGIFKVAFGGLVLTATVSSSGSSFIIKKI